MRGGSSGCYALIDGVRLVDVDTSAASAAATISAIVRTSIMIPMWPLPLIITLRALPVRIWAERAVTTASASEYNETTSTGLEAEFAAALRHAAASTVWSNAEPGAIWRLERPRRPAR
jgi:hypothetical protein